MFRNGMHALLLRRCCATITLGRTQAKPSAQDEMQSELMRGQGSELYANCDYGMNDPYMPLEATRNLTGQALRIIAENRFPVHIITKSDLVLRDLDTLKQISQTYAAVSFTITTADDALGKKVEPGATLVSKRLAAMKTLAENDVLTGVTMMPILPFIEDSEENIRAIVEQAHANGARYILAAFGMTMRDRQREYYYTQLDRLFPGVRERYERAFGERYSAPANHPRQLEKLFHELCARYGIATHMPLYTLQKRMTQPSLF